MTVNRISILLAKRLTQALLLAFFFTVVGVQAAQAQDYKVEYNDGLEAYKAKNLDQAYTHWEKAATLARQAGDTEIADKANYYVAQLDYKRGLSAINSDNYDAALQHFNKGIERRPSYSKNYLGKGLALKKLNRTDEAMATFVETVEVANTENDRKTARSAEDAIRDNYLFLASSTLTRSGGRASRADAQTAINYLNKLEEYLEANADSYYYYAVAYEALGDVAKTMEFAQKALDANPSRGDAARIHLLVGELQLQQGNIGEARSHLQQAAYGDSKARAEALLGQLGTQ